MAIYSHDCLWLYIVCYKYYDYKRQFVSTVPVACVALFEVYFSMYCVLLQLAVRLCSYLTIQGGEGGSMAMKGQAACKFHPSFTLVCTSLAMYM